ncbi:MAG: prepilin-type N-terminal cleavage/methylation domain-containing protein, partial [Deltaproteobacteria bacterium]|nr:prepilin-type N-terminal cleavage/methylation domain-containing protein [Deltaproteobacteria bacterium]
MSNNQRSCCFARNNRGFTLIEILIAVA